MTRAICNLSIGDHPHPTIFAILQGQEVCFVDRSTVFQWTITQRWYHQNGYGMRFSLATEHQKFGNHGIRLSKYSWLEPWQITSSNGSIALRYHLSDMYIFVMLIKSSPLLKFVPFEDQANGADKTHERRREGTWRHCSCRLDVNSNLQSSSSSHVYIA